MAVRATLSPDDQQRPGHAVLTLSGVTLVGDASFRLESNQPAAPHLQPNGEWGVSPEFQPAELQPATANSQADNTTRILLGPLVVDALVKQGAASFRVGVEHGGGSILVPIRILGRLLGSGAVQRAKPVAPAPAASVKEPIVSDAPEPKPVMPVPVIDPPQQVQDDVAKAAEPAVATDTNATDEKRGGKKRKTLLLVVMLLVMMGGAATAWLTCTVSFLPAQWQSTACVDSGEDAIVINGETPPNETIPPAASAYEQGMAYLADNKLLAAKRQFTIAANEDQHVEAMKQLASMYDPARWTATTSPLAAADWETANWWWEKAAAAGDVEAKRKAGHNMVAYGVLALEREKGRKILQTLADNGDEKAKTLLQDLDEAE